MMGLPNGDMMGEYPKNIEKNEFIIFISPKRGSFWLSKDEIGNTKHFHPCVIVFQDVDRNFLRCPKIYGEPLVIIHFK